MCNGAPMLYKPEDVVVLSRINRLGTPAHRLRGLTYVNEIGPNKSSEGHGEVGVKHQGIGHLAADVFLPQHRLHLGTLGV